MNRLFVAVSLALCACLSAGSAGSSLHRVSGVPSIRQGAREYAKEWLAEPHPAIKHVETVRLAYGAGAAIVELAGHFTIHPMCRGLVTRCPTVHTRRFVLALSLRNPRDVLGLENTTAAQLARIARARHARPEFRIFPDFATEGIEGVRCTIPRSATPGGGAPGICLTQDSPYRYVTQNSPYRHPHRVKFIERWPLSRRVHDRNEAVWTVTFNRSGQVRSIRVTGHPPQLQK